MEVTVTVRFYGVEDGHVQPRWFEVGETIKGSLAEAAVSMGNAEPPKKRRAVKPEHVKKNDGGASPPVRASRKRTRKKS